MAKKSAPLRLANKRKTLIYIAVVVAVTIVGGYLLNVSRASGTMNEIALISDDTTKSQVYESVKADNGEITTTAVSQPFDFIASKQGEIYCKTSENQMNKVTVGRKLMELLVNDTKNDIQQVKSKESDSLTDKPGRTVVAYDGKNFNAVNVRNSKRGARFNKLVSRIKARCLKSPRTITPAELPNFTFPDADKPGETAIVDRVINSGSAQALGVLYDLAGETLQLNSMNLSRYSRGIPNLKRTSCVDTVARTWTVAMGRANVLSHNPNFGKQISDKCALESKWPAGKTLHMAENVGYGPTSQSLYSAFANSPGHWANIIERKNTNVGIGAWQPTARMWITHNFYGFYTR